MNKGKRTTSLLGMLLMVVSLIFIARQLITQEPDFSMLTSLWRISGIGVLIVATALILLAAAINYKAWVRDVSAVDVALPITMTVYLSSNLYKYIPGSVLYLLGRQRLAIEHENLKHSQVALATLWEGIFAVIAAAAVALLCASGYISTVITEMEISVTTLAAILSGIAVSLLLAAYLFRRNIAIWYRKLTANKQTMGISALLKRMIFALGMVFLWGVVFLLNMILLGHPATPRFLFTIIGLYLFSWLVGLMIPGVPGGLGVREAALLLFMGGVADESILLPTLIIHRLNIVLGDVLAYLIAVGYAKVTPSSAP